MSRYLEMSLGRKFISGLRSRPLVWDTITTTVFSTLGKGAGLLIPFFIATWFGISTKTDAFFFAYGIIIFVSQSISPVVESVIVPYIHELKVNSEDIGEFVGKSLMSSALFIILIVAVLLVVLKPFLPLILPRFSSENIALTYLLLLETSPLAIFMAWTSILGGTLNALMSFRGPALSPALRAFVTICFIFFLKNTFGVHSIIIGYVCGEIFRFFIMFGLLSKSHLIRIRLSLGWGPPFRNFLKTASYQALGMSIFMINAVINKTMVSWLGKGCISIFEYAERIYLIPVNFIGFGLAVTLLSHWSRKYYEQGKQKKELQRDVKKAVKAVLLLCTAITFLFIYFKSAILSVMLGHGRFPVSELALEGEVLTCFLAGFVFSSLTQIYMRAYLVLKKTNFIFIVAIINMIATVLFNLILMRTMGVAGIALSASIGSVLAMLILAGKFHFSTETER